MTGFIEHFDTAHDYTLQLTITHTLVSTVTRSLVVASQRLPAVDVPLPLCSRTVPDLRYQLLTAAAVLKKRRYHLNAFFLTQVYLASKFCPPLQNVGLRDNARHIRDFSLFNVPSSSINCPSDSCVSAANAIFWDVAVFGINIVSLSNIL
jgi:hypothetical protein